MNEPFVTNGPDQVIKRNFKLLLQNNIFKDQLALFLMEEWKKDHYSGVIGPKRVVVSHGGSCINLSTVEDGSKVTTEEPEVLQGVHEEADTLIAFHASKVQGNIVVRASDTDVLVILIGMMGRHLQDQVAVSYDRIVVQCGASNTCRYIDAGKIVLALESRTDGLASALPGLHALTGTDFTAAFYRKGKVRPLDIVQRDVGFVTFFSKLSTEHQVDTKKAEEFVCALYGKNGGTDINGLQHAKLLEMTSNTKQVPTYLFQ